MFQSLNIFDSEMETYRISPVRHRAVYNLYTGAHRKGMVQESAWLSTSKISHQNNPIK